LNEEVDELLAVEKAFPEVVPLPLGHDQLYQVALAERFYGRDAYRDKTGRWSLNG
jgi:hypothetical protein